jgi:DNA-directed RNA polymerase specialized sigma24 family protein
MPINRPTLPCVEDFLKKVRDLEDSFRELWKSVRHQLHKKAARELQGSPAAGIEGSAVVLQDVELEFRKEVLTRFLNFRGDSEKQFVAYLLTMVQHRAAEVRRKFDQTQKRDPGREVPLDEVGTGLKDPDPTPATRLGDAEEVERLIPEAIRRLTRLSARQRLSFFLGEYTSLSDLLIGQLIGRADDNAELQVPDADDVQKARHKAYRRLEELYPNGNDGHPPDGSA